MRRFAPPCLIMLAFAACAFGAGSAQAETSSNWKVKGVKVSESLLPSVQVKEVEGKDLILLSKVGGTKTDVLCTGATLSGVKLEAGAGVGSGGKARFSGCKIKLAGSVSAACEPKVGAESGVILSNTLSGAVISSEGTRLIRFPPSGGETLATIETSASCSVGSKIPVVGSLTLKDLAIEAESPTHLVTASSATELWLVSESEEHRATMDGSVVFELGGEHSGFPWSTELHPSWRVSGANLTAKLSPELRIKELVGGSETLLTTVLGTKFEKTCTGAELIGAKLETEGKVSSGAKVKFTGCVVKLNGELVPSCEPHTGPQKGVITTNAAKGVLALHEEKGVLWLEPVSGTTFITVELGEECAVGEKVPLIGKLALEVEKVGTEEVTHFASEDSMTTMWLINKTAEHKVTLDGGALLELAGEHKGLKWSGVFE